MSAPGPALLYDADCRLCRFLARAAMRLDTPRTLSILPFGDPAAEELLAQLAPAERKASWRLALPDGSLIGRGAGLPLLLRQLPATRPLGALVGLLPDRLLNAGYDALARRRRALGRLVPDGPAPERQTAAAISRASDSTASGAPDDCSTRRSQRSESPGA